MAESPWEYKELREIRLNLTKEWLAEEAIDIIVDETGDPKKGKKTD